MRFIELNSGRAINIDRIVGYGKTLEPITNSPIIYVDIEGASGTVPLKGEEAKEFLELIKKHATFYRKKKKKEVQTSPNQLIINLEGGRN